MREEPVKASPDNSERGEPKSSNHIIWGMTAGLLIGTALAFLVFDNVAVGIAIGMVIGAILATLLYRLRV